MNDTDIGKGVWLLVMIGMTFGILFVSPIAYYEITEVWTIFQSVIFMIVAVAGGILIYGFIIYQYLKAK